MYLAFESLDNGLVGFFSRKLDEPASWCYAIDASHTVDPVVSVS